MKTTLPELKAVAIRQSVADALREALLQGALRPGEGLSELDLAAQMKVSRGPIREALLLLTAEGLVVHSHNRGFSVPEFTAKDQVEIECVRLPLEALALDSAKKRITKEDLKQMEAHLDTMLEALRHSDFRRCVRADFEFHQISYEASGNAWLVSAIKRIMVPYFTYTMAYRVKNPRLTEDLSRRQHRLYLDFLSGQSSQTAEDCVRFHLCLSNNFE